MLNGWAIRPVPRRSQSLAPMTASTPPGIMRWPPTSETSRAPARVARPRRTEIRQNSTVSHPIGMMAIHVASRKSITPAATWLTLAPPA